MTYANVWPAPAGPMRWKELGTNVGYLKSLVDYWQREFDWRKQEAKLNTYTQFRADINGLNIYFIHERGKGPIGFGRHKALKLSLMLISH